MVASSLIKPSGEIVPTCTCIRPLIIGRVCEVRRAASMRTCAAASSLVALWCENERLYSTVGAAQPIVRLHTHFTTFNRGAATAAWKEGEPLGLSRDTEACQFYPAPGISRESSTSAFAHWPSSYRPRTV